MKYLIVRWKNLKFKQKKEGFKPSFNGCIINSVGEISHHTIFIYKKDMDL